MAWQVPGIWVIVRTVVGFPLAAVLGVVGMAIASALAVFFGVSGLSNNLALLMIGAGVGAGIGAGLTMLRVDSIPSWPILIAVGLVLALLSTGGAWVGFQIGGFISDIEDARCVGVCGYFFKPRTYIALGATLVPNVIAMIFNIAYESRIGRPTEPFSPANGPALSRSDEGEDTGGRAGAPGG